MRYDQIRVGDILRTPENDLLVVEHVGSIYGSTGATGTGVEGTLWGPPLPMNYKVPKRYFKDEKWTWVRRHEVEYANLIAKALVNYR